MNRRLRLPVLGVLVLAAGLLAGCGAQGTGVKGYVDGDGVVKQFPAAHRAAVDAVKGVTLEGKHVDLADERGKVVVVNVWGSWCGDCREEAADLAAAAKVLMSKGVVVLGIDTRDGARGAPRAYQRAYRVPYPSIFDPDGQTLLAFRKASVPPTAIPSTVVIDAEGRIAAVILGAMNSKTTLYDLVHDAGGPNLTRDS